MLSPNEHLASSQHEQSVPDYHKIYISSTKSTHTPEKWSACLNVIQAVRLREKYVRQNRRPGLFPEQLAFAAAVRATPHEFVAPPLQLSTSTAETEAEASVQWDHSKGSFSVPGEGLSSPHSYASFAKDLGWLYDSVVMGKVENTYCYQRLELMELNYKMHTTMNSSYEDACLGSDDMDFPSVMKVDNHIHAAGAMTELEFLRFLQGKLDTEGETIVNAMGDTLSKCMRSFGVLEKGGSLTTDALGMRATEKMFHRFDHFNDAYNPLGKTDLRTLFMKTSNHVHGRYFAELIKSSVFTRCSSASTTRQALEPRMSIYGFGMAEWLDLGRFFVEQQMALPSLVRWQVQVPRLCNIFMGKKYKNFGELLMNIFDPVVQATLHPEKYPQLHILLSNVGGFDSVDDESINDSFLQHGDDLSPFAYTAAVNPSYSYWLFHMNENIKLINELRERRGMNTFRFAPHCAESGPKHHAASAFLTCDAIMHGVKLVKHPVLVYLFYICQIGMALCPLSNDKLFLKLRDSPVGRFQAIGMNYSLNTDDPLQFHNSLDPLLEEYLISSKAFDLSVHDLSEIAYNSVKMSSFDHETKVGWLGERYDEQDGYARFYTNPNKTNICAIRSDYRNTQLLRELNYVYVHAILCDRDGLPAEDRAYYDAYFSETHNTKHLASYKFFAEQRVYVVKSTRGGDGDDQMPVQQQHVALGSTGRDFS